MAPATLDSVALDSESALAWLAQLLLQLAQERSLDIVLRKAIDAAAAVPGVAMARVYLLQPGDICPACPQRSVCPEQDLCLHAVVSGGKLLHAASESWSRLEDDYRRIPLGNFKISQVVTRGEAVVGRKEDGGEWIANTELAEREQLLGFVHQPIKYKGTVLGALGVLLRVEPDSDAELITRILADHLGAAIAGARAFAEVERLRQQLASQNEYLREEIESEGNFGDIVGQSPAIRATLEQVELVAPTDATVLILGESGTGKELVAREIHRRSARSEHPLVKVNCAAVPPELYESEFFGHVKGSFTGAFRDRVGRFEVANGGTLFLDEVGEIPLPLQSKLLRVLQEGAYERVGDERTRRVDVRILAATNRDLKQEVATGRFRNDLYYRLNVFPLTVAPLRERKDDIPLLAAHLLKQTCQRLHMPCPRLTKAHVRELQQYDWPGNIRELQNVLERAVIMARRHGRLHFDLAGPVGSELVARPLLAKDAEATAPRVVRSDAEIRRLERENIQAALEQCGGRIRGEHGAAQLLGLPPTTLAARIKALKIPKPNG